MIRARWRCGSRFCPTCSRRRRQEILQKLKYFSTVKHCVKLELTFPASSPDPEQEPEFYSHAWDIFLKRTRRIYGKFNFMRFVELTKAGVPHYHIILDRYIDKEFITRTFPECGGGQINWIRRVDQGRAFLYVTKYISKEAAAADDRHALFFFFSGMRQYSASRGLFIVATRKIEIANLWSQGEKIIEYDEMIYRHTGVRRYAYVSDDDDEPVIWFDVDIDYDLFDITGTNTAQELMNYLFLERFEKTESKENKPVIYQ